MVGKFLIEVEIYFAIFLVVAKKLQKCKKIVNIFLSRKTLQFCKNICLEKEYFSKKNFEIFHEHFPKNGAILLCYILF